MPTRRREVEVDEHFDKNPKEDSQEFLGVKVFENPPIKDRLVTSELPPTKHDQPSLFRFFLDGSRRIFSIAEIIVNKQYFPILAGQIGVGVVERCDDGRLRPCKDYCIFRNVIVFPDTLSEDDYPGIKGEINKNCRFDFDLLQYKTKKLKKGGNFSDLAIAKIMQEMHSAEINTVHQLAQSGSMRDDRMLIIDGGLQFGDQANISLDSFRNVVAVAKTFQPNVSAKSGREKYDIGTLAKRLDYGDRTCVFGQKFKKLHLGNWYLKLRPKKYMDSPLQGVAKVEVFASDRNEIENGIDSARVQNISKSILSERNVTPYGKDARWAVHLYPIFQVEQYLKSRFINSTTLMEAF